MERSENINELAMALAKFQGQLEQPSLNSEVSVKTNTGGTYKFKYADLAECKRAAKKPLEDNGLSVCQLIEDDCSVRTILLHSSGQFLTSKVKMPFNANNAQSIGSAITYAKRYSYCAILGIVADDDEDANIACGNTAQKEPAKKNTSAKKEITRELINNDEAMEQIARWIYKNEVSAKEAKQSFSVESLVNKVYTVGKVEMQSIMEIYNNYKINNNLP